MAGRERGTGEPDGYEPSTHRMVAEQRWFDDFRIGERFPLPRRNVKKVTLLAFQSASGDKRPIHYDRAYRRAHGLPDMLARGLQVAIQTAAGAGLFPHLVQDSLRAFLGQSSRFLRPA